MNVPIIKLFQMNEIICMTFVNCGVIIEGNFIVPLWELI